MLDYIDADLHVFALFAEYEMDTEHTRVAPHLTWGFWSCPVSGRTSRNRVGRLRVQHSLSCLLMRYTLALMPECRLTVSIRRSVLSAEATECVEPVSV